MKPLVRCFGMFLRQIAKDTMLYAILVVPILAGSVFRFGVPVAEAALCRYFGAASILSDYYLLFDLMLAALTPVMFCFTSAMVILSEYDENMVTYHAVTPVSRQGYIISRLVFPSVISVFGSVVVLILFSLTKWSLVKLLTAGVFSGIIGVVVSFLTVSFSHNRVEGMAVAKLSSVILLGIPIPFFLFSGTQYLFSPLPSFWLAKFCIEDNYLLTVPALLVSLMWIVLLYARFAKKLS